MSRSSVLRYATGYAHVYTLTVAHDHTFWGESGPASSDHDFFVGTARVLVHNSDCPPGFGPPSGQIRLLSKGQIKALKDAGYDIHEEKGEGRVAQFDLYQDQNG